MLAGSVLIRLILVVQAARLPCQPSRLHHGLGHYRPAREFLWEPCHALLSASTRG